MSSHWPDLMPEEPRHAGGPAVAWATAASTAGGATGWALCFLGLGLWGLAIGAVIVFVVLVVALGSPGQRERRGDTVLLSLAICLLTWPLLYIAVGYVRYRITGQSLGE